MIENIGETAGLIWHHLNRVGEESIYRIGRELRLSHALCNQAIGWLAREGKIKMTKRGRGIFVSLNSPEGE